MVVVVVVVTAMGVVKSEAMVVVDIVKMSMVWVVVVMVVEEDERIDLAFVADVVANVEDIAVVVIVVVIVVVVDMLGECAALGLEIGCVEAVQNDLSAVVQVQAVVVVDNSTEIQPADDVVSVEE